MTPLPGGLVAAVQANCHIADAAHAADLSLCTYLLQMREYFRWEQGLPLGAALVQADVAAWLAAREALWAGLEGRPYETLPHGDGRCDAFDANALNERLMPHGWVYGAGLAGPDRPGFFVARLEALRPLAGGLSVQVCGRELARGLFAPPAALLGTTIVLRRDALARWLWERFEAFAVKRVNAAFKAVADAYGLERDFHAGLPRMLDELGETLVLHEVGEHHVGRRLEPGWAAMRLDLHDRRTELHVGALRDQLADLTVTLPELLARGADPSIHFWFANYEGLRRALYPTLVEAYRAWCAGDRGQGLRAAATRGAGHFLCLAEQALALHARDGAAAAASIAALLSAPEAICRAG